MEKEYPETITKAWIGFAFKRPFRWVRVNLLTDEVLTNDLEFELDKFRNWRSFPPVEGARLKKWLKENDLLTAFK